jgi:hypothetical protein
VSRKGKRLILSYLAHDFAGAGYLIGADWEVSVREVDLLRGSPVPAVSKVGDCSQCHAIVLGMEQAIPYSALIGSLQ